MVRKCSVTFVYSSILCGVLRFDAKPSLAWLVCSNVPVAPSLGAQCWQHPFL